MLTVVDPSNRISAAPRRGLEAAQPLFTERGFHTVTMDAIAAEADVAAGSMPGRRRGVLAISVGLVGAACSALSFSSCCA